ncbi:MAG: hypothetical protein ACRC35_01765 [Angustibacter sp.]
MSLLQIPPDRRPLATVVAVGSLAVLCVAGLVLGLQGLFAPAGSEPTSSSAPVQDSVGSQDASDTPVSGQESDKTRSTETPDAADRVGFLSPTGNIGCTISSAGARCDITERDWQPPPKPASCTATWGQGLQVDSRSARMSCVSDRVGGGDRLSYGQSLTRGEFTCRSAQDGMTCTYRPNGHGFTLSRMTYDIR